VALERASWLERRFGATIDWLPFDLHPEYPAEGIPYEELRARYGDAAEANVRRMVEDAGLPLHDRELVPSSRKALILAELARDHGKHDEIHPRLLRAYWAEGRDIGSDEVLLDEARAVGLDEDEVRDALATRRNWDRIEASTQGMYELGAGGVPAWVIDDRLLLPGAQPHEVFERVLTQLGHEPGEDN
jgi:predicted DsbA family dithiol-disulfide isomerase